MKIKHLRFNNLILAAVFAMTSSSLWAQSIISFGVQYGTGADAYWIYYNIINDPDYPNAVEVYNGGGYNKYSGAIEVPETVTHSDVTYTVCGVAAEAFYDTRTDAAVTSVSLPATVSYIGDRAFYQCKNMTTVNIPSAVTSIGSQAFFDCRKLLISEDGALNIPNAVTTIGSYAFQACHALKNVTIGTGVTSIGEGAFMGCTGLETINYNAANCTSHGSSVWSGCTHTPCTLNIGNTVQSLPNSAFSGYSALTTLNFVATSQLTTISQYAFSGCTNIGAINIPNSVTSIEQSAFRNCEAATSLNLGSGVVTIGKAAFAYCYGLTSLDIPANVKTLERNDGSATGVFASTGLTSLVIPNTLESLGREAFANCPDLETVTIGTGVTYIDHLVFAGCPKLSVVNYNVTEIPSVAEMHGDQVLIWNGCTSDCTVNIGDNVKGLPHDIFRGFTHLKTINFGAHENFSIGSRAFDGCTGLTTLDIPDNVTTLAENAFEDCSGLTTVRIGDGVTAIGHTAFEGCTGITSLDLGAAVQTIGSYAFSGCTSLTSLTIPASVTTIDGGTWSGTGAFHNCTHLKEIWFMGATRPSINQFAFDNVLTTALGYVPKGYANIAPFTNVPYLRFVGGTNNNNWNEAANWAGATGYTLEAAPANNEVVVIDGENDPYIPDDTRVKPGKIILGNGRKIILGDRSELVYGEPVQVTVIKNIDAAENWTTASKGWYFIASPINSILSPTDVQGMITADDATVGHTFDLYKYVGNAVTYEGDPIPWQNYRVHSTDFYIENGAGYLYANLSDSELKFSGVTKAYNTSNNFVELQYDGWNLIGNPFAFNVSADRTFAALNENKDAVEYKDYQYDLIKPCEGIAVYGSQGDKVYFQWVLPLPQSQSLNMVLTKANMRDAKHLDNVIVSFDEGEGMPKFNFMEQDAKIYIPQDGKEYAIVHGGNQGVMPLNFVANENGEYAITVDVADVEMSYLHLIDNLTGADVDLLSTTSYQFAARKSDYVSRFKLVFSTNGVDEISDGDDSFAYYDGSEWVIANPSTDSGSATLQVVDMMGRVVSSETVSGNAVVSINQPAGVYVMRLLNGENVRVQKVVVR